MTATELIEKACEDICDNYCKKPAEWAEAHGLNKIHENEDFDAFVTEVCNDCPLNLLR